ncbi:MAG TPA: ABC-F family ATP-binding cassette domain-containing protein [Parachlamydiaceae bacterium]|nr:ABC-F family ATP-binding cassette domain-containing protein [Parachlamydiaceae bacterium]
MISVVNLSMRFGGKILFQDASFQLLPRNHYGLVGPNGSGKSTLLKILNGDVTPEKGDIALPSLLTIGSLNQDHFLYDEESIRNVVMGGKPTLWKAMQAKEALLKDHHHFTDTECKLLESYEKTIQEQHGYSANSQSSQLLEGLGIPSNLHDEPMKVLSGGYKLRVLLAQLLFSAPDVLLLDEPTNHLDIFSIRWLEQYLKTFPGTLLLSSHDRQFLNTVCDHIIDIDYAAITVYKGNYDAFEIIKEESRALKENVLAKQEKRKEEMEAFVERFKAKASKATQAQSRVKAIEKLELTMDKDLLPSSRRSPKIHFEICRPSGAFAIKVAGIGKAYGPKKVLHDVCFEIERGERVAFLGANGIGKSTLLEILIGNNKQDHGTYDWGYAVHFAYFPQDHTREVSGTINLLDWLGQFDSVATREILQKTLARSLFSGDDVEKSVSILSGGETARLILAKMMLIKHNVLIFDEPTNHLDMEATEALIQALKAYPGTILFVSHNRHFINSVATRVIEMSSSGILDFKCSYADYNAKREHDLLDASKGMRLAAKQMEENNSQGGKQDYLDQKKMQRQKEQAQRKIELIEKQCHELEMELHDINELFCSDGFYTRTSKEDQEKLAQDKQRKEKELHAAFDEWEKLSSL